MSTRPTLPLRCALLPECTSDDGLQRGAAAPEVELAPVADTATNYALFMFGSSNTRYQLVNSFEGRLLPSFPGGAAVQTGVSVGVRTFNNYLGAASWMCAEAGP